MAGAASLPETDPIPTPLSVYGNNAAVACPCGKVVVVRSLDPEGKGVWRCACGRGFKGFPEGRGSITHLLVWKAGNQGPTPDLRVRVEATNQAS
jgi:hypothetical protein